MIRHVKLRFERNLETRPEAGVEVRGDRLTVHDRRKFTDRCRTAGLVPAFVEDAQYFLSLLIEASEHLPRWLRGRSDIMSSTETLLRRALACAITLGLASHFGITVYAFTNTSGHTGFSPYLALLAFVPVALLGLTAAFCCSTPQTRWYAVTAAAIGLTGIGLLVYLDWSNSLLQYETWIRRGMP